MKPKIRKVDQFDALGEMTVRNLTSCRKREILSIGINAKKAAVSFQTGLRNVGATQSKTIRKKGDAEVLLIRAFTLGSMMRRDTRSGFRSLRVLMAVHNPIPDHISLPWTRRSLSR